MARGELPALAALDVCDPPRVWRALGFTVGADEECVVGGVTVRLGTARAGEGLSGWALRSGDELPQSVDGIATQTHAPDAGERPDTAHPNGAVAIDHVVVRTPDLQRTLAAMQEAGLDVRRVREARPDLHQAFLWAGDVLVEVAGPPTPTGDGPASLWGLVIVAPDLDAIAALPGAPLGSVRPAAQEGRLIATVGRELGSSVPLAFMTPHQRNTTEERT